MKSLLQSTKLETKVSAELKKTIDTAMKSAYEPKEVEHAVNKLWEERDCFKPRGTGQAYCIMQPPPNVTGVLHMGHAFQTALMDAQIRYRRMLGQNTLWQPGLDHAGIATQMVVENQLRRQGKTRDDLGREEFVNQVWKWKDQSGGTIVNQFHRLGTSADWERSRFTMDPGFCSAVSKVFVSFFDEGLLYRGERLVNWDPALKTAVSDVEVISEEETGSLWHIRYQLAEDREKFVVVATTRPETLFGDVAVAVNSKDERYKDLIGKNIVLPIANREIPIIADNMVDMEFGTGAVKITPAHDFNDFAVSKRHNLPLISILTEDAHLNENVPVNYQGLDRFAAREKVIQFLKENGALDRIESHVHKVPKGEKSGAIIEPRLTKQWFVKMKPLAEPAIKAVQDGRIKFYPERWSKNYFQWMENIEDWCVSRQLWWGHRIPAWYDEEDNIYVGPDEAAVRSKYNLADSIILRQDPDVLDTWFSAGLWPFVTLGWPEQTPELETFFPTNVLVTGFDILFFWVARMTMLSLKFTGEVPFKEVYITGLLYDKNGKKMSKSKGNVIDPIDLIDGISLGDLVQKRTSGLMLQSMADAIEKATIAEFSKGIPAYGTDALRFALMLTATPGNNVHFNTQQVEMAKHFCNKIWNAVKYVTGKLEEGNTKLVLADSEVKYDDFNVIDKWMISRLQKLISDSHRNYTDHRYDLIANQAYEFVWNDFCDWYLEFSKQMLRQATTEAERQIHLYAMVTIMEAWVKILHPAMPFITEALWQTIKPYKGIARDTVMLEKYPEELKAACNLDAEKGVEFIKRVTLAIRGIRSSNKVPNNQQVSIRLKATDETRELFAMHEPLLKAMNKLSSIQWIEDRSSLPPSSVATVNDLEIFVPLSELLDKDAEIKRLTDEIGKTETKRDCLRAKLSNASFTQKAPQAVIDKDKDTLKQLNLNIDNLKEQLEKVKLLDTAKTNEHSSDLVFKM